jgi:hypothetical protein
VRVKNLVEKKGHWSGGMHRIYRFPNGYGASVIPEVQFDHQTHRPYAVPNLYELAVLKFKGKELDRTLGMPTADEFELCYDTQVTSDVLRALKEHEVNKVLKEIEAL